MAEAIHTSFSESVVLERVYVTVPFHDLPPALRTFVNELAGSVGAAEALRGTTPVLTLFGTHGQEPD